MKSNSLFNDIFRNAKAAGVAAIATLVLPWSINAQVIESGVSKPAQVRLHYGAGVGIPVLEIIGDAPGYQVEGSRDLETWELLGEAEAGHPGEFEFEDSFAGNDVVRFYRVIGVGEDTTTAIVVESYRAGMAALAMQQALIELSKADLQRVKNEMKHRLKVLEEGIGGLEKRAATKPVIKQVGNRFIVRWVDYESSFNDRESAEKHVAELEQERAQAAENAKDQRRRADELRVEMEKICDQLEKIDAESEALNTYRDELAIGILGLDETIFVDPCFERDRAAAELAVVVAERVSLEQEKRAIQGQIERIRAEVESLNGRTWHALVFSEENGAVVVFDGERFHFDSPQEAQQFVSDVVEPQAAQAEVDLQLFEGDIATLENNFKELCDELELRDAVIDDLAEQVAALDEVCNNAGVDPRKECEEIAFQILILEGIRQGIADEKEAAQEAAEAARERGERWQKIADQPVGTAVGNEFWVFWGGNVYQFADPFLASEFIQIIESFREFAAEQAQRANHEAEMWEQRVKDLCDELEMVDQELAGLKDALADAIARCNQGNGNAGGNNGNNGGGNQIAERDRLALWVALLEALRDAVEAEKVAAVKDAQALQDKADQLEALADSALSYVEPEDGKPYFIVQGVGGIARIPVVQQRGESFQDAFERTRQAAQALHDDLQRQKEQAARDAQVAQAVADGAQAKVVKLCDELEEIETDLADAQQQLAAAVAAANQQLNQVFNAVTDCLKCYAKKLALALLKLRHAGLVQTKNKALKDAQDAREDADRKHKAANVGLSLVINHTDGRAIAALGDQVFPFSGANAESDARKKHQDLKDQRDQLKKDAKAAEAKAKAAEAAADKACADVDESQKAIDKCQMELDELKKKCPLC